MSKLKGPLLSMDATGSIGKMLTFSKWKGIAYARQYVTPSNPNTTAQQAQRSAMQKAVVCFREVTSDALDALNRSASLAASAMSGANVFTKQALAQYANDPSNGIAKDFHIAEQSPGEPAVSVKYIAIADCSDISDANLEIRYGTNPRVLGTSQTLTYQTGATYDNTSIISLSGGKWYFQVYDTDSGLPVSGIAEIKSTA